MLAGLLILHLLFIPLFEQYPKGLLPLDSWGVIICFLYMGYTY